MSITDELREWMRVVLTDDDPAHAIADRIDAEHEEKVSYWQGACYEDGYKEGLADNEDAMAEHGWVKLPVDADGEVIHIGDVMEWVPYDEDYPSVVREVAAVGADVFFAWDKANRRYEQCEAHAYRHYHEPTVEDVLREFVERWHDTHHDDIPALFAEYAARLQLRSDAEVVE